MSCRDDAQTRTIFGPRRRESRFKCEDRQPERSVEREAVVVTSTLKPRNIGTGRKRDAASGVHNLERAEVVEDELEAVVTADRETHAEHRGRVWHSGVAVTRQVQP